MDLKTFGKMIRNKVKNDFDNNRALAGREWGCSGTLVALVIMAERAPNQTMLDYCGYDRVKTADRYVRTR